MEQGWDYFAELEQVQFNDIIIPGPIFTGGNEWDPESPGPTPGDPIVIQSNSTPGISIASPCDTGTKNMPPVISRGVGGASFGHTGMMAFRGSGVEASSGGGGIGRHVGINDDHTLTCENSTEDDRN